MSTTENEALGAMLSDGTAIRELFDLDSRRLRGRVFCDPEIHRAELARIFGRSWQFVAFSSELPEAGDFVVRRIGADSVVVTRGSEGDVHVFLNRCAHRGVQLCMTDCGNTEHFKCPYHGWVYDTAGRLEAMPAEREWLGAGGDKGSLSIRPARVEVYAGMVFATFDHDVPDFVSSLGEFKWYFDIIFNSFDKPLVAIGPPQRWVAPFNWKLGAENFVGDGYHGPTAHGSVTVIMPDMPPEMTSRLAYGISGCEPTWGHGFYAGTGGMHALDLPPNPRWAPPEVVGEWERNLTAEQALVVWHGARPSIGTLFPNFSWIALDDFFLVRTWEPISPEQTEIRTWTVAHPDATDDILCAADQGLNRNFGLTGMLEQDDMSLWARTQRSLAGSIASQEYVHYRCSRPPELEDFLPDGTKWPGPGPVWQGFTPDDHVWNFHLRWLHSMTEA